MDFAKKLMEKYGWKEGNDNVMMTQEYRSMKLFLPR